MSVFFFDAMLYFSPFFTQRSRVPYLVASSIAFVSCEKSANFTTAMTLLGQSVRNLFIASCQARLANASHIHGRRRAPVVRQFRVGRRGSAFPYRTFPKGSFRSSSISPVDIFATNALACIASAVGFCPCSSFGIASLRGGLVRQFRPGLHHPNTRKKAHHVTKRCDARKPCTIYVGLGPDRSTLVIRHSPSN